MRWRLTLLLCWCCICLYGEILALSLNRNVREAEDEEQEYHENELNDQNDAENASELSVRGKDDGDDGDDGDDDEEYSEEEYADEMEGDDSYDDEDDEYDDDDDVNDELDTSMYIMKVMSDAGEFTGTIISPLVLATDAASKTTDVQACTLKKDSSCYAPEQTDVVDDVAFLRMKDRLPEPLIADKPTGDCVALGISHDKAIKITVENEIVCGECADFDAVICGLRLAGILRGKRSLKFVGANELIKRAGIESLGKEDKEDISQLAKESENQNQKPPDDKQYQDSGEDELQVRKDSGGSRVYVSGLPFLAIAGVYVVFVLP